MKKIKGKFSLLVLVSLFLASCGNGSNEASNEEPIYDSLGAGPAPDNNDATNPSLADTAYSRDDSSNDR